MDISKFTEIDFPENPDIVYYLFFRTQKGEEIPIYVGETSRNVGRFGDYVSKQFSAPTDFKVGEAVSYLLEKKFPVGIKYHKSDKLKKERRKDETNLKSEFRHRGHQLLNDMRGCKYKEADETQIREQIHKFMDGILNRLTS